MKNFRAMLSYLFYLLLVVFLFCGCEHKNLEIGTTETSINGIDIKIYVIDKCEYIGQIRRSNSDVLTHKGNCKFCTDRLKN